jgi:hypothetical protein
MLQAVSKSLNDNSRVAVKEALYVFGTGLDRLRSLGRVAEGNAREATELAAERTKQEC